MHTNFPYYFVLKASAGAGKTRALSKRYIELILSNLNVPNSIENILAITFSNNSAFEMKERIILMLKKIALRCLEENETDFKNFNSILAKEKIDYILDNYSSFRVQTIDSFFASVFKASQLDFGYTSDFEILMNNSDIIEYAFDLYLSDVGIDKQKTDFILDVLEDIVLNKKKDSSYPYDPSNDIILKLKDIYEYESHSDKNVGFNDNVLKNKEKIERNLENVMKNILSYVSKVSDSKQDKRCKVINNFDDIIKNKSYYELFDKGTKILPVKEKYLDNTIRNLWDKLRDYISNYAYYYSKAYYRGYVKVLDDFKSKLDSVKILENVVFIEDINKKLCNYLNYNIVPDIYFKLGSKIYHFLIDEFQDTSIVQWKNIRVLIENALSENGSLFVVGDIKQSIYGFRNADYKIMKDLIDKKDRFNCDMFLSDLLVNYRSYGNIVEFNNEFFSEYIKENLDEFSRLALDITGLSKSNQNVFEENKNKGYVEVRFIEKSEDNDDLDDKRIKEYIIGVINDLRDRGYDYSDITILAYKNDEIVKISNFLNDEEIPFISYSSLDVRKRKVFGEIISLLNFLDSPIDNFSFACFITGDIYRNRLKTKKVDFDPDDFLIENKGKTLYVEFKKKYPDLWEEDFDEVFKLVGYLPIYDLLSRFYKIFDIFGLMKDEEATLIKILNIVKEFEEEGYSSIKRFVEFIEKDDDKWSIDIGKDINAVKIMTIHKAKGLEFDITIVYLSNRKDRSNYIYKEETDILEILKINSRYAQLNEKLKIIKDSFTLDELVGDYNTLYVALTRAKYEMYILGFGKEMPYNIPQIKKGEKTYKEKSVSLDYSLSSIIHFNNVIDFRPDVDYISFEKRKKGEYIHKILSEITYFDDGDDIGFLIEKYRKDFPVVVSVSEIKKIINDIMKTEIKDYFSKISGFEIKNEFRLCDSNGDIKRPDRVVISKDRAIVVDYKTGFKKEKDIKQIKEYCYMIKEIYKKDAFGYLVYVGDKIEVIRV